MTQDTYVIIMAGGIGSRFWPYSRNHNPKQFLDVLGTGYSLLEMTYRRFLPVSQPENIYLVTNAQYAPKIKEKLPELKEEQILLEPIRRNTAPCVAYAAYKIFKKNPAAKLIVTPADHAIFMEDVFINTLHTALESASSGDHLVTIGIKPNRPETGYGYIQFFPEKKGGVHKVKTFTEKPELEMAKKFLDSGDFFWNAGIFIWTVESIIRAFEKHLPEIAEIFEEGRDKYYTDKEQEFVNKAYSLCKNISIDYGVMEKAQNVYVALGDFGWSDLGSWNSLYDQKEKDKDQNVALGNVMLYDCEENIIKCDDGNLILVEGLSGYLVAQCNDVTVICRKENEKKFREFVADVKERNGDKYL